VGAARHHENQDEGHGYVPKLILAGRLTGTLKGRPVVIEADESGLLVSMPALQTAWSARQSAGSLLPVLHALKRFTVPLRLRIAGIISVEVLPSPSSFAKFIAPALHRLG